MNRLLNPIFTLILLLGLPLLVAGQGGPPALPGQGQNGNQQAGISVSANAGAGTMATIITPIAISKTADLDFGNIASGATSGVVTLPPSPTPARTTSGGAMIPSAIPGNPSAAAFAVSGHPNATYSIILPTSVTLTRLTGSETIEIHTFITANGQTGMLDASGQDQITVGATMDLNANQTSGVYQNQHGLTITVAYN